MTGARTIIPIGAPIGGGFFAGLMAGDGAPYGLVVAPKAEGDHSGLAWKTDWLAATPGADSVNDGRANTDAMIRDSINDHPAANWVRGLAIGGFSDWYIPSRDELEICYRYLKPGRDPNWTYPDRAARWSLPSGKYPGVDNRGNGHNATSEPPGEAYAKTSPAKTKVKLFRQGGAEAFDTSWYWSSTEFGSAFAWFQYFGDGYQGLNVKCGHLRVRAVRKILI